MSSYKNQSFEDKEVLKSIEDIFIQKRGGSFEMPKNGSHVILLLSGGTDSLVLWSILMGVYKLHVHPLHIAEDGNTKSPQIKAIREFSKRYKGSYAEYFHEVLIRKHFWNFSFKETIAKHQKLLNADLISSNITYFLDEKPKMILTNYPTRMEIFSSLAYEYALALQYQYGLQVHTIFAAIIEDDRFLTRESTLTVLKTLNLGMCLLLGDWQLQFSAPLEKNANFDYSKKEIYRYAIKHNLPLEKTWSCNFSRKRQCGRCTSCLYRKRVFNGLNTPDKTLYGNFKQEEMLKQVVKTSYSTYITQKTNLKKLLRLLNNKDIGRENSDLKPFDKKITISPHISWTKKRDKVTVLNTKNMLFEYLNNSSSFIWKKLSEKPRSINELTVLITKRYQVEEQKARKDIHKMIDEYIENGTLTYFSILKKTGKR